MTSKRNDSDGRSVTDISAIHAVYIERVHRQLMSVSPRRTSACVQEATCGPWDTTCTGSSLRLVTSATIGEPGSHVNNKLCNGTVSVCQSHLSPAAAACGGLVAVRPTVAAAAGYTAARRSAANASSVTLSADVGSWTQTCSKCIETRWNTHSYWRSRAFLSSL